MEALTDLKAILHSKRANIYYLEKCRVMQKDGRVLYLAERDEDQRFWNIPIANTTALLLGTGTSITQPAVRMLSSAGVMIGFSGGGATPLLAATDIEWLSPQSEYRPTEYLQGWMRFWFEDEHRLDVAKQFQMARIEYFEKVWTQDKDLKAEAFDLADLRLELETFRSEILVSETVNWLLRAEAQFTKALYKYSAKQTGLLGFTRQYDGDQANSFLNHGNYLAYGLGATTLWVLGIPFGFAVMHGKTRRGALVFDVADLVKDAVILPWAFISAKDKESEQSFRQQCLLKFTQHKSLDFMFNTVKKAALEAPSS
ncbi:type I-F CRISPR-associated endonuclease Cas1f [Thiomicrorhabdus heinhorstiae]|uniref:Type I-F CRISPR-associated endonuclease Cas1 n=1 Tax=Thiomicrorhabdus heinhorstiae TaxID=2748010 RepID=A0ABS0BXG8_9GAMM|nr:type I-F CRISPR-associated endonuclease Cas1f [Thiomicrorhabdus heinhorstiae]MBF6057704.1 type I-F CRISPR-associated endonuclease Cas1 [Thiomicrorhabdus heinhorstiae]